MRVRRKIRKLITYILVVSFLVTCMPFLFLENAEANNIVLDGYMRQPDHGRNYWQSSNLREWLNSSEEKVNYTCNSPSKERLGNNAYDDEPGFLSEFTLEEQNAIAVTEHRVFIAQCDASVKDGGSGNTSWISVPHESLIFSTPGLLENWDKYSYQKVKDKVYLLNIYELYSFVQKRGYALEKKITDAAREKYSYYNENISYWINATSNSTNGDGIARVAKNGTTAYTSGDGLCAPSGVVPVINLKPNWLFPNGKLAKNLSIGEIVIFGRHLGEPIEWRVINIQDGYPMLLAEKAISIKAYDAPGDPALAHSEYINFSNEPYIERTNPIYTAKDKSSDTISPNFIFDNENELYERQNDEFVLSLKVEDESVIEGIILPDGRRLNPNDTKTEFQYTVTQNGNFLFTAWDIHNNYKLYVVPVGNINVPATVVIKPSADGWTNKDVTVDINATSDVGYKATEIIQNRRDFFAPLWTNYTSYTGKRIRITGNVEFVNADKPVESVIATAGISYKYIGKSQGNFFISTTWKSPERYSLKDLQENGKKHFDVIYTVPGNYHSNFRPWLQLNIPFFERAYTIKWTDVEYQLLDKDDLQIEKITLPTGEEITDQSSYRDILTEEGEYKYTVLDSRGIVYERIVKVLIDKVNPMLNVVPNKTNLTKEVTLTVTATDNRSGIKEIKLPNGSTTSNSTAEYIVRANGSYTFEVHDRAGNITKKTVSVNNIFDSTISHPVNIRVGGSKRLSIIAMCAGHPCGDITKEADCISSNQDVAEVIIGQNGEKTVRGRSKGDAVLTITYEGVTATIPVTVRPKLYVYIRTLL
jgi:hypothetical protein